MIGNIVLSFGLPLIGIGIVVPILVTLLMNEPAKYAVITLLFWAVGLALFLKAKVSVKGEGKFLSSGSKETSRINRIFYSLGCVLMAIGLFLTLALIAFYKAGMWRFR